MADETEPSSSDDTHPGQPRKMAALFVKLGVIGFGGPAAHIAMMRDGFWVERWPH